MAQLPCIGLSWPLTKNPPVGSGNRHLLSLWCNMVHLKMMGFQIQKLLFPGCHFQVNHVELWEGVTTKIPQRIASLDIQRAWWERIWTSKTYRSNHRSPQFRCLDPPNLSVDCQRMSRIINSATPKDSGDMDWTDHDLWLGWLAKKKLLYFEWSPPWHVGWRLSGEGCHWEYDGKNGEFENIDFRFPWLSDTSEMGFGHDVPFLNYSDRLPHPSDSCQPDRVRWG